jgi:hypothetical protein
MDGMDGMDEGDSTEMNWHEHFFYVRIKHEIK